MNDGSKSMIRSRNDVDIDLANSFATTPCEYDIVYEHE